MPKSSNEPGLEVARFIVSAAEAKCNTDCEGKDGHAADFTDVFLPPSQSAGLSLSRDIATFALDESGFVECYGSRV